MLSDETNVESDGKGCVRTFGSIGHGGLSQVERRYCMERGEWVEVARRHQSLQDRSEHGVVTGKQRLMEYLYARRGDSLALVRQREVTDQ